MTKEQDHLSNFVLSIFRLNGELLELANELCQPAGLTAAEWQVLGAVLHTPLSIADIARSMGITRQSVQRTANGLVRDGLAVFQTNPQHKRAKLLTPTNTGISAIKRINPTHRAYAKRLAKNLPLTEMQKIANSLAQLTDALEVTESLK